VTQHVLRDIYIDEDKHVAVAECSCSWRSSGEITESRAYDAWADHELLSQVRNDEYLFEQQNSDTL
jgi:hypothetical protein